MIGRAFTVMVDGDAEGRGLLVLAARPDGALLVADGDSNRLRWVPAESCRLAVLHFNQDEREWWRSVSAAAPAAGLHP